jgi:hypothetical protein
MKPRQWHVFALLVLAYAALLLHAFVPHHHHQAVAYFDTQACEHHHAPDKQALPESTCETIAHAWAYQQSTYSEAFQPDFPIDLLDFGFFYFPENGVLPVWDLTPNSHAPPTMGLSPSIALQAFSFRGPPSPTLA